ncbi:MAG: hypothetical protein ACKO1Y_08835 [Actinomycetota bacterium]
MDVDIAVRLDVASGDKLLERRCLVEVPGADNGIWVTSAEDQVLRKLDWYRQGGSISDRQWRVVVGILRVHGAAVDLEYLTTTAQACGIADDVRSAMAEADLTG